LGFENEMGWQILPAMAAEPGQSGGQLFLGIECGGTRTVALLADGNGRLLKRLEAGAANLRLLSNTQLRRHFKAIAGEFPRPSALGIGMAGMRTANDQNRILAAAAMVWPRVSCVATDDLETALAAHSSPGTGHSPLVLVLSGTGSCCYGKDERGRTAKVGGWGHILGDDGSGYDISLRALKAVIAQYDRVGKLPELGRTFLRSLLLNEPSDFIAWAQDAGKTEIAALAREVFGAANRRDTIAVRILDHAATCLAQDALTCAGRLAHHGTRVEFVLAGGILLKQSRFARQVAVQIKRDCPRATVLALKRESVWGAVELAKSKVQSLKSKVSGPLPMQKPMIELKSSSLSPTEQRNPRSMNLDQMSTAMAIKLMLSEDTKVPRAILRERRQIEAAIKLIVSAFRDGGRLFYVGAGTSGRLGILDASECPPTFRTPPELVQGIIAGGPMALSRSVEGAEDDVAAGARAIEFRGVSKRDIVVGIAASGRTPFVWGALKEAKRRGAKTVLLCFNPSLKISRAEKPDLVVTPNIGPEVLTGSTRLKAGTATKLILNLFTTLAMVRLGKVVGNLMVDLNPSNTKLRGRAVRIVRELTGADESTANRALERSGWVVKKALVRLR
jgi:N-acetylmuramic acid 6-phosphate etherase